MLAISAPGRPGAHADRGMNARPALSEARDQRILRALGPDVRNWPVCEISRTWQKASGHWGTADSLFSP